MPNAQSFKVLLVEDEGLIARDIAQRLEGLGHRVAGVVSTGEEAVEMAAGADIVLMDIRLDGPMDGIEAARTIRLRHGVPVIFLTAHADRSTLARAKQAEPFGYIVKPVAPAALHTSIEIAVYKHAMERELAEREAWLRAVFGSVADAVAVADAEGRVRILNPAAEALTGWSEAEARGQDLAKIVSLSTDGRSTDGRSTHGRAAERADPLEGPVPLALLRDAAVPFARDTRLVTRGGRSVAIEGSAAPVRVGPVRVGPVPADDAAIGVVLSFRDVSRRRWEEQQLRQAQKVEAAARLAAGIADEYSNLLTVIRGQAERLVDQFADYSPARQSAEEIRQAAAAAEEITRKLAGLGKRQPAHPEVVSPNGVLRRMAKLLETVAGTGVKVTVLPGLHVGKIKADEGQLEQLLLNLTIFAGRQCAGRQCSDGVEIRIETGPAEMAAEGAPSGYVRIAVAHPHSAVSADAHLDAAAAGDESLALAVVHNIASGHGGFLSVRRLADGQGCLEVLLPRWTEAETAGAAVPPAPMRTILLVEPREIVRAELHKYFEANGFNLLEAADAAEAIALAEVREGPLDVVIARAPEAERIQQVLRDARPELAMLRIVDAPEQSAGELRRSYTQTALLERVRVLIEDPQTVQGAAVAPSRLSAAS
jgi:two-component system, cell cycle sensor histidine kinase and response regulator CckA